IQRTSAHVPTAAARVRRNRALIAFEAARDSGLGVTHRADRPLGRTTRDAQPGSHRQECLAVTVAAAAHGKAGSLLTHFIIRAGVGFAATAAIFARRAQIDFAAIARLSVAVGEARVADEWSISISTFAAVRAAGFRARATALASAIRSAAQAVSAVPAFTAATAATAVSVVSALTALAAILVRGSGAAAQVVLITRSQQRAGSKHAAGEQPNHAGRASSHGAAARFRRGRHALAGTGGSTSARELAGQDGDVDVTLASLTLTSCAA